MRRPRIRIDTDDQSKALQTGRLQLQEKPAATSLCTMSSDASNDDDKTKVIDLDSMSLDQLNQVKQQEEGQLEAFTNRFAQLRAAAARISASKSAVSELSPASEDKQIMVPLTESLYVPARIRDADKLMVELGTGYYCEKNNKDTLAFLDRKLKLVNANSENVTKAIQMTKQNVHNVTVAMQGKMLEIRARQEGVKHQQQQAAAGQES